ncbi:FecR family protein [Sphingomonas sp. DT-207]|uniref:FecR family protein n=1 Tax=Sphingomonas sp. DT-207 TaxID=3396167 RepID=UPI003F1C7A02
MTKSTDRVEEAAAAWDARLRGARASFRDRRAFHAWLEEDPEHRATHDRLQTALSALRAHADLPELSALRDEARFSVHENRRRRLATMLTAAAAAVLLCIFVFATQTERGAELAGRIADDSIYATSLHERTRVTLDDGSVVTLDAGTRLAARFGAARRDITLLAGHALFQVAKDPKRPFVVQAGGRTITALGTVFDVRVSPEELRVTLAEGVVAVRPASQGRGARQQILKPNQQLIARTGASAPELRVVDTDKAVSWADGQVFFDNEPLASAAQQMNQYSHQKITVGPSVADLRISGMFRTSNQQGFLDALEIALPVEVRRDKQGHAFVSARAGDAQ